MFNFDVLWMKILAYFKTGSTNTAGKITSQMVSMNELLAYLPATAAHPGLVELATHAEALAGSDTARALTAAALAATRAKTFQISFSGRNGAGACTAVGLAVGDIILSISGLTDMGIASANFEATVTVADQIQQTAAGDLSTKNFLALAYRPS
jgi:hypothetical protein